MVSGDSRRLENRQFSNVLLRIMGNVEIYFDPESLSVSNAGTPFASHSFPDTGNEVQRQRLTPLSILLVEEMMFKD